MTTDTPPASAEQDAEHLQNIRSAVYLVHASEDDDGFEADREFLLRLLDARDARIAALEAEVKQLADFVEHHQNINGPLVAALAQAQAALRLVLDMTAHPPGPDFLDWVADRLICHGDDPNVDFVQALRRKARVMRKIAAPASPERATDV